MRFTKNLLHTVLVALKDERPSLDYHAWQTCLLKFRSGKLPNDIGKSLPQPDG